MSVNPVLNIPICVVTVLIGTGCYIWYSEGSRTGCGSAQSLLAVPNVTAHPPMVSVPITVLLYNGPLFCGINV